MKSVRILLVDFLDSYSHNIPAFIRRASFHYDLELLFDIKPYNALSELDVPEVVASFDGVVLSPGPGTVDSTDDLGDFAPALLNHRPPVPVFGVCLGYQAICKAFGATIQRLNMPHHGLISDILDHNGKFLGRCATRYHSLEVCMTKKSLQSLFPQAVAANFDDSASRTLMEVAHRSLPLWGVQYHPESIYSTGCGIVVQPFLQSTLARSSVFEIPAPIEVGSTLPVAHANTDIITNDQLKFGVPDNQSKVTHYSREMGNSFVNNIASPQSALFEISWKKIEVEVSLDSLIANQREGEDFVLLDSSTKGNWDILASTKTAQHFRYSLRNQKLKYGPLKGANSAFPNIEEIDASVDDMWAFLEDYQRRMEYQGGPPDVPFWGGFIGYFSYELGLAGIGIDQYPQEHSSVPEFDDIQLLWSTETLVYNKPKKELYLISLTRDEKWIEDTSLEVGKVAAADQLPETGAPGCGHITHPSKQEYIDKIFAAQEELKAGNSYEICLTALSKMFMPDLEPVEDGSGSRPSNKDLVRLFSELKSRNPAEFMSALGMGDVAFLSASPEEFLSFDAETGIAKMKPIKGTLSKKGPNGEKVTIEEARKALGQPKVIAENLMIVDLVRNDLSKVSDHVHCPELLWVEEIETMYQLISTIEAVVKPSENAWHLLKHTLPPGSMTGAPKRRSCQIIQSLEQNFRGLYSGVLGYIDVRGNCRTSVSIRNAAKYRGETHWHVGAGGAITNLSDAVDEWEERQLKARSLSQVLTENFEVLETVLWDHTTQSITHIDRHVDRLLNTIKFFGFKDPVKHMSTLTFDGSKMTEALREHVENLINVQLNADQKAKACRISIKIDPNGNSRIETLPIQHPSLPRPPVHVLLDPDATKIQKLESFVYYKTTWRNHYTSARDRAGVKGADEVLLFQPKTLGLAQDHQHSNSLNASTALSQTGRDDDLLAEGSYTNVAVFDEPTATWRTPATGCLPGIQRQILLEEGKLKCGDIQRSSLQPGLRVKLFNSVRGCFDGVIA